MTKKKKRKSSKRSSKKSKIKKLIIVLGLIVLLVIILVSTINKYISQNKVAAVINNEEITSSELNQRYDFFFFISGYPEEYKQMIDKGAFIEQIINEKLILKEAANAGISFSDSEVGEKIDEIFKTNLTKKSEFEERLNNAGFSFDYFTDYFKNQLILIEFLNDSLFFKIEINNSEIADFYIDNKESFINEEGKQVSFNDVKESIKSVIRSQKEREVLENYIVDLRDNAEITNYLIEDISFTGAAARPIVKNDCAEKYSISSDTIIFYHTDWCPHCNNMMPIVKNFEEQGYNFFWAEADDKKAANILRECFSDIIQGGVPQFICSGTKEYELGEMPEKELKKFIDKCKNN